MGYKINKSNIKIKDSKGKKLYHNFLKKLVNNSPPCDEIINFYLQGYIGKEMGSEMRSEMGSEMGNEMSNKKGSEIESEFKNKIKRRRIIKSNYNNLNYYNINENQNVDN